MINRVNTNQLEKQLKKFPEIPTPESCKPLTVEEFLGEPKWGPIGKEVYERTYSRTKADGTKEIWAETVKRVVEGNTGLVDPRHILKGEKEALFHLIYNFGILPAGRHLWVAGVPGRQYLFNCHNASWGEKVSDHHCFLFLELMKGGGTGTNYSNRYIKRYGAVENEVNVHIVCDPSHPDYAELLEKNLLSKKYSHEWDGAFRVQDSKEGWVESLRMLIDIAMGDYSAKESFRNPVIEQFLGLGNDLVVDVSLVRAKGLPIKGFGGTASGPWALAKMLLDVAVIFNSRLGSRLHSLDFMEIDHAISACVVAGNVRRSARMSIKSYKDVDIEEFINCKKDSSKHWSTNISVEVDDKFIRDAAKKGTRSAQLLEAIVAGMLENGEPGIWNYTLSQKGEVDEAETTNPCGEICLNPWENCNLGHINMDYFVDSDEQAEVAFRLMTRFLIRATFGDIQDENQLRVVRKNRRIGVGVFGFHGWVTKQGIKFSESHHAHHGVGERLRNYYEAIRVESRQYSSELRIPEPIKATTVAPTGSISNLPGKAAANQSIFAPFFIRRVRYANNDPKLAGLIAKGYPTEPCIYAANTTVVSFPCEDILVGEVTARGYNADEIVEGADDITLADHLAVQRMFQEYFVDNSISYTVNVKPGEYTVNEVAPVILRNLPHLKGTTIMVDGSRPQSPFTRCTKEEYDELASKVGKEVGSVIEDCKNGACPIK